MHPSSSRAVACALALGGLALTASPSSMLAQGRARPAARAATRPSPQSVLDRLSYGPEWLAPDPSPAPSPVVGVRRKPAVVAMRTVGGSGPWYLFMTEDDSAGRAPCAAVGDTLLGFLVAEPGQAVASRPLVVVARRRVAVPPDVADGALPTVDGWTYLLAGDTTGLLDETHPARLIAMRAPFEWAALGAAPSATRAGFRPVYVAGAQRAANAAIRAYAHLGGGYTVGGIREQVMGEDGTARWSDVRLWAVHGPRGAAMAVGAYELNDDPSDHGQTTSRTVILSSLGRVLAEAKDAYDILTVVDMDGDGVDEILTTDGSIRYDGTRWLFPKHKRPYWD